MFVRYPRMLPAYAELHCLSNFTFLRGASHPEELVERAQALGYAALALTDECSLAGVVRAHLAASPRDCRSSSAASSRSTDGTTLALYATDRASYGDLAQLITRGRRNAAKGSYALSRDDVAALAPRCLALWLPRASTPRRAVTRRFADATVAHGALVRRRVRRARRGSASSCSRAPATARGSNASLRWRAPAACRWRPRATCTCTRARGARCRTR